MLTSLLLALPLVASAYPWPHRPREYDPNIRPLVLWHGLGDTHSSPGMLEFIDLLQGVHPGLFVHSVYIEKDLKEDQKAAWFGNLLDVQLPLVASQLAAIPELNVPGGFDAIGFSQGGQFLRAYNEFYNSPPIHNLITFGSQHMGVSNLPGCVIGDIWCRLARNAAMLGVYTDYAQHNLIQAQYFRDHNNLPKYLEHNQFLTLLNNELDPSSWNETYKTHLTSLANLVLIMFTQDKTVVPMESAWFGSYAAPKQGSKGSSPEIIPMRLQPLYQQDTIGLRTLDENGQVHLESCDAEHMHLKRDCWEPIVKKFVGSQIENTKQWRRPGTGTDGFLVEQN